MKITHAKAIQRAQRQKVIQADVCQWQRCLLVKATETWTKMAKGTEMVMDLADWKLDTQ